MTETIMPATEPGLRAAFLAPLEQVEIRESAAGNGDFTLTGHAAVFDRWSEELWTLAGAFREKIAPGAFTDVLKRKPDVRLLFNHDGMALARTRSGTLELTEDEEGLKVWARLAPTTVASDLRLAMQRGDIDQMSFAFTVAEDSWHEDSEEEQVDRTILRVADLFDVSVVTYPAYPDTDVTMREIRAAASEGKIHLRTVIPFRSTPKAEESAPWNGPAEVARADVDDLRAMCAWYDSNAPENKGSYKLPHHRADGSHPVVWRGVRAAMGRLMQSDIPQDDKRGCHSHLSSHYDQFDKEAPAFEDLERALELDLPDEAFETRTALREAVAQAETDPAGSATPDTARAETDPVDAEDESLAPAETDPAEEMDALLALKARSAAALQEARETKVHLTKEMLK